MMENIMNKRKFICIAGETIIATGITAYLLIERFLKGEAALKTSNQENKSITSIHSNFTRFSHYKFTIDRST
jgi:predicted small secreted protein